MEGQQRSAFVEIYIETLTRHAENYARAIAVNETQSGDRRFRRAYLACTCAAGAVMAIVAILRRRVEVNWVFLKSIYYRLGCAIDSTSKFMVLSTQILTLKLFQSAEELIHPWTHEGQEIRLKIYEVRKKFDPQEADNGLRVSLYHAARPFHQSRTNLPNDYLWWI